MSRAREFDDQVVVQRAMRLFWRKGYETATLPELLRAMRISRGSFYNAFGTKRDVLIRALRLYMSTGMDGLLAPLGTENAGRAEIEKAFSLILDYVSSPRGRQGCLIGNSMTDVAMRDAELRDILLLARRETEDALVRAYANGQASGTIPGGTSPRSAGRFMLNTISGLMVSCKSDPGQDELRDIVRLALRILD
ncbi:MAG: TetR/AcrR family transcriptional regulator [Gammaproteobacteria bacterium]|nr:TetR/AcrR family transcriptional regulator [Gammaproteobacteria bacterium]